MDITDWESPDPALIVQLPDDAAWDKLADRYKTGINDWPLRRCLDVARQHNARTVVVETRYADPDYRSEYAAFYARLHRPPPAFAHRLHFFAGTVNADVTSLPTDHGYIGYISVRPINTGAVSRAMLPPPPGMPGVRCTVTEQVGFFGQRLTATGVPFAQQDALLGACAHIAAWICHYVAHLRGDVGRRVRADFALHADASLSPSRALPTAGLTVDQLSDLLRRFDLPPIFYMVGSLPNPGLPCSPPNPTPPRPNVAPGSWDHRITPIACRHLNGGHPVLVGNSDHAFVLVGWTREPSGRITFVRHDDQRGPYRPVLNPLDDHGVFADGVTYDYRYWRTLQVPLPPKLWLSPESAELKGGQLLLSISEPVKKSLAASGIATVESLDDLHARGRLAIRSYVINSEKYKQQLPGLGFATPHVQAYRLARLPKLIWVVEAIDRDARSRDEPCVVGEAIVNSGSSDMDPDVVAYRLHGVQVVQRTDGTGNGPIIDSHAYTRTGGIGSP